MTNNLKKPLSIKVAEELRVLIQKNKLESGVRLNEPELCEKLGVSRTPLREAFGMLKSEGLVDIRLNKGAYVADPPIEHILQMFEAMAILEGNCARLFCDHLSNADLARLEELHDQLRMHYENQDHEGYMDCNHLYHTFIQEKSGNLVLSNIVSSLRNIILLHRYRQIYCPGRLDQSMDEHSRLIEAFRARDGQRAERLMRTHLHKQGQALVSYYADIGLSMSRNIGQ